MGTPAHQTQEPRTPPPPLTAEERAAVLRLLGEWERRAADDAASEPDWNPDELFSADRPR